VVDTLQDMFGRDCVPKTFKGNTVSVEVDGKTAIINFKTLVNIFLFYFSYSILYSGIASID